MPHQGYLVDANLLTLLVAGRVNRTLIAKRRRLSGYTTEHYESSSASSAARKPSM